MGSADLATASVTCGESARRRGRTRGAKSGLECRSRRPGPRPVRMPEHAYVNFAQGVWTGESWLAVGPRPVTTERAHNAFRAVIRLVQSRVEAGLRDAIASIPQPLALVKRPLIAEQ
eukprot:364187-Chlamydomonas_euryale.AAC.7